MLFYVHRTSRMGFDSVNPPCDGAILIEFEPGPTINGQSVPGPRAWVIEMPDLGSLSEFVNKYGQCVIDKTGSPVSLAKIAPMEIEIYDDYRE